MKHDELETVASSLDGDFRSIEPHLRSIDKHLTLRTYLEGFSLSEVDKKAWQTLRGNKVAMGFIRKNSLPNLTRWFNFIEQTHPEIQEEAKAADAASKAKTQAASKAGANYNLALQDTDKGVVTRFLPEPSYVP
jgi:glutamyl-tRNA synthetase